MNPYQLNKGSTLYEKKTLQGWLIDIFFFKNTKKVFKINEQIPIQNGDSKMIFFTTNTHAIFLFLDNLSWYMYSSIQFYFKQF